MSWSLPEAVTLNIKTPAVKLRSMFRMPKKSCLVSCGSRPWLPFWRQGSFPGSCFALVLFPFVSLGLFCLSFKWDLNTKLLTLKSLVPEQRRTAQPYWSQCPADAKSKDIESVTRLQTRSVTPILYIDISFSCDFSKASCNARIRCRFVLVNA